MKILNFFILILILIFLFIFPIKINAQSTSLSIIAITYQTREDIDFLFQNSTQVLEYLEGIEIDKPTFLSLVTTDQKNAIQNKGYSVRVLEENADINRFVLLYNPQVDQAEKLRSFGEPIVISSHYTLLKLASGKQFTHEGESGHFFDIPFSKIISPPPLQTKTADPVVTETPVQTPTGSSQTLLIGGVIVAIVILGVGFYLWMRKRRQTSEF